MKKILLLVNIIFSIKHFSYGQTLCESGVVIPVESFNQCDNNPWILVFQDEFQGNSLDLTKWNIYTGVPRDVYFTSQKAWHKADNIKVENGLLKITAKKENLTNMPVVTNWNPYTVVNTNFDYTTGEIWTDKRFTFGKFEARVKIPRGKGFFPAFWLYSGNPWNEIDVFEFWNEETSGSYDESKLSKISHMTTHYDDDSDGNADLCTGKYSGNDFSQGFHTFTVEWEKNEIKWYIDGVSVQIHVRYLTMLAQRVGCEITAWTEYLKNKIYPKDPMHIILNFAIQNGDNSPNNGTPFPSELQVDYVKYYKRIPCSGTLYITDLSTLNLSDDVFNVITANTITLDNFIFPSDKQLEVIARDKIVVGPGFKTQPGSNFIARIDKSICPNQNMIIKNDPIGITQNKSININDIKNEPPIKINEINNNVLQLFPNPNNGLFNFEFKLNISDNYNYVISEINGTPLVSDNIKSSKMEIDLTSYAKGVYLIRIFDSFNNNIVTQKIIKY